MRRGILTWALLVSALQTFHGVGQSCCEPAGSDFPKVGGNYGNQNYSSLSKINKSNIAQLGAAWHDNLEGGSTEQFQQATVVAVGGVLYVETTQGNVFAVDGKTGKVQWKYTSNSGPQLHRGVAVGGGKVFATLADSHVVALNQATGAVVWDKQISTEPGSGSLKTAGIYYDGMIYLGSADGQRAVSHSH